MYKMENEKLEATVSEERIAQLEAMVTKLTSQVNALQVELGMKANLTEVDRIHKRLDTGDLSTSFERELVRTSKGISKEIDNRLHANLQKNGLS